MTNPLTYLTSRRPTRPTPFGIATLLVALGLLFVIIYPIVMMLRYMGGHLKPADWIRLVHQPWFADMARDTVIVVAGGTLIAVVGAIFLAWVNERTDAGLGTAGEIIPLVPLFLPSVAVAIGWVLLATPDVGFLNHLLDLTFGAIGLHPSVNIYSYVGVAFVIGLICLPYAFLPISAAFKTIDPALEEAARVNGAGPLRVLLSVAIPAIRPAIQSAIVLVLVVAFAQYSVPEVIGTPANLDVMSVRIIHSIRVGYPPDYKTAVMLSSIMFAILAVLWFMQRNVLRSGQFNRISGKEHARSVVRLGAWRWPLRICLFLYVVIAVVLPFAALIIVSFQGYWQPALSSGTWTTRHYAGLWSDLGVRTAITNSIVLGLIVGAIVVVAAAIIMYYANRRRTAGAGIADAVVKLPAALPNLIIGIAIILGFAGPPFRLGGTLTILAIGFLIISVPYAAIASESSFASVHPSMREASYVSGAGEGNTLRRIVAPLVLPGLFAAYALVFVHILGDLVVAVLLGTGNTPVIGFLLLDTWQQGTWGVVASLSMAMTVISTPIVLVMLWSGVPRYKRRARPRRGTA